MGQRRIQGGQNDPAGEAAQLGQGRGQDLDLGAWLTASLQLRSVTRSDVRGSPRAMLAVSGLAVWVWVPMVLAVAWATGQHVDVPVLSIPDMARTHGLVNALGFDLCGLAGHRLAHRRPAPRHQIDQRGLVTS